jgi:putative addiction module component (TIGR02574 family)
MIAAAEIERMGLDEKLRTMELLWDSISRKPDQVHSPAWHRRVLADRLAMIERGEARFLTIDEVKRRLRKKRS